MVLGNHRYITYSAAALCINYSGGGRGWLAPDALTQRSMFRHRIPVFDWKTEIV